ncbi:232_t:CDS:2, partial [Funneliformis mosseae]
GDIEQLSNDRYKINGNIHQVNNVSVRITELPIRVWTQNYKESLELWISGTDKVPSWILEYKEDHTTTTVDFTIKLSQTSLRDSLEEGLEKRFKMSTTIGTSNMVCFDGKG